MNLFDLELVREYVTNELQLYVNNKSLVVTMEGVFSKAAQQQYVTPENRADGKFAASVWVLVTLLDAAIGGKSYPAEKYGIDMEWESAVRFLKFELKKRKFLSGQPVYDLPKIGNEALDALQCLDANSCGAELVKIVREKDGSMTDLFEAQHDLTTRIKKLTDTPGLLEALQ